MNPNNNTSSVGLSELLDVVLTRFKRQRCHLVTLCHPDQPTFEILTFGDSGPKRQSARMSEIKNVWL